MQMLWRGNPRGQERSLFFQVLRQVESKVGLPGLRLEQVEEASDVVQVSRGTRVPGNLMVLISWFHYGFL